MTSIPMEKRSSSGMLGLPRKRRYCKRLVPRGQDLELPENKIEATFFDRIKCAIRSFILMQAEMHLTYHEKKHLVALPAVITAFSDNPDSKVHLKCLTNYPLEDWEIESMERDAEARTTLTQ